MVPVGEVFAQLDNVATRIGAVDDVVGVDTAAETLVVGGLFGTHDTVLLGVAEADGELRAVGATRQVEGVAVLESVLVAIFLKPVGAFPSGVHLVEDGLWNDGVPYWSSAGVVEHRLVDDLHVFLCSEGVGALVGVRPAYIAVVLNGNLAGLALLGGHENNAVGGTCTVDGSGGSILQDVDALDFVGVKTIEAVVGRTGVHAVDDKEW